MLMLCNENVLDCFFNERCEVRVIVAGNGPSLKNINYKKVPSNIDVFRCNQFYFEDEYYLGKKIKKVFFRPSVFVEQYYTIKHILNNGEYECDEIVFAGNDLLDRAKHGYVLNYAVDVIEGYDSYIKNIKEFDIYKNFNTLYFNRYISMGVYMCAVAVACGYKEIYLVGIDFYDSAFSTYAFASEKNQISKLVGQNNSSKYQNKQSFHSIFTDLEALEFLQAHYDVKIYSLVDDSPASKYFPVVSIEVNDNSTLFEEKDENTIKDIMLPHKEVYSKINREKNSMSNVFKKKLVRLFLYFKKISFYIWK